MSCCAAKYDLSICKGSTFRNQIRLELLPYRYATIVGIQNSAPVRINAPAHGLIQGWRFAVESAKGLTNLNAAVSPPRPRDYYRANVLDSDNIEINELNSLEWLPYLGGGVIRSLTPWDLTAYASGRMDIRASAGGELYYTLNTVNGGIVIDAAQAMLSLLIPDEDTAAFTFTEAVYDLELVTTGGEVNRMLSGTVLACAEVTTTA